ncbi:MAG: hypothetical protein K8F91_03290 [Candidatus Obscuribacterales bacterium]|nr:hypothetical protein [Candidatus Obscuribacterales bacterium]
MNPLRAFFLKLSKLPPALMLLIIIGLAVLVTMMVTGRMSQQEAELALRKEGGRSPVVVTSTVVPAQTRLDKYMVEQTRLVEPQIWPDAITSVPTVVGRTTVHAIPANAQIREIDLK